MDLCWWSGNEEVKRSLGAWDEKPIKCEGGMRVQTLNVFRVYILYYIILYYIILYYVSFEKLLSIKLINFYK